MRALFSPVIIVLILAGFTLSYGSQDAPINLKQLVQNQIAQIKAREVKQESAPVEEKTQNIAIHAETIKSTNENKSDKPAQMKAAVNKSEETGKTGGAKAGLYDFQGGLFLKIFVLVDLSLLAALFVYWRRRKLKIGKAEKAKFKKNITKLRSEAKFRRRPGGRTDEVRKKLQMDPVCDTEDEDLLLKHARKLSVPSGELMLASRIRSLEKARE